MASDINKLDVVMFSLKKELGIAKVICKPPVLVPQNRTKILSLQN